MTAMWFRPANVVLALAVGLALMRVLGSRGRQAGASERARAALLMQSVAGEEDPGAALDELRPPPGVSLH